MLAGCQSVQQIESQALGTGPSMEGKLVAIGGSVITGAAILRAYDGGVTITDAHHRFISVEHPKKTEALVRELAADRGLALVFVRTKHGADRLARNLRKQGFRAGELHGGMSQPQRERSLGRFASGANDVLVATDVAARGLDLEDITHVINFDAPADEKAYVHRVGRTARAGRGGEGVTFVTPDQRLEVGRIAKMLGLDAEWVRGGFSSVQRPQQQRSTRSRGGARRGNTSRGGRPRNSA